MGLLLGPPFLLLSSPSPLSAFPSPLGEGSPVRPRRRPVSPPLSSSSSSLVLSRPLSSSLVLSSHRPPFPLCGGDSSTALARSVQSATALGCALAVMDTKK